MPYMTIYVPTFGVYSRTSHTLDLFN